MTIGRVGHRRCASGRHHMIVAIDRRPPGQRDVNPEYVFTGVWFEECEENPDCHPFEFRVPAPQINVSNVGSLLTDLGKLQHLSFTVPQELRGEVGSVVFGIMPWAESPAAKKGLRALSNMRLLVEPLLEFIRKNKIAKGTVEAVKGLYGVNVSKVLDFLNAEISAVIVNGSVLLDNIAFAQGNKPPVVARLPHDVTVGEGNKLTFDASTPLVEFIDDNFDPGEYLIKPAFPR